MSSPIYRVTRPGDEAQLLEIWRLAYDGDMACAELYFNQCYHPGDGITAEADGTLCSAIYLMDGYRIHLPGRPAETCTYLYALGTPAKYRGRGYGGRTIWHSGVEGYHRGTDWVCFLPASPSLYRWYARCLGTYTVFFRREFSVTGAEPAGTVTPISPQQYGELRERLLAGTPHAEQPLKALSLQGEFCRLYGGGLVEITLGDCRGVGAFDREGDTLTFRELLFPQGDPQPAARAVLAAEHAAAAQVRTPAFWHTSLGNVVDDNVLVPGGRAFPTTEFPPYWGVSLD